MDTAPARTAAPAKRGPVGVTAWRSIIAVIAWWGLIDALDGVFAPAEVLLAGHHADGGAHRDGGRAGGGGDHPDAAGRFWTWVGIMLVVFALAGFVVWAVGLLRTGRQRGRHE
jgi:hypothetical protein